MFTALLEDMELRMVHQNSLRFWKCIAYDHHYGGVAYAGEEGDRLARILGEYRVRIDVENSD